MGGENTRGLEKNEGGLCCNEIKVCDSLLPVAAKGGRAKEYAKKRHWVFREEEGLRVQEKKGVINHTTFSCEGI